jgi:hypothetical protein
MLPILAALAGSVISSAIGAHASNKASKAQAKSAQAELGLQKEMFDTREQTAGRQLRATRQEANAGYKSNQMQTRAGKNYLDLLTKQRYAQGNKLSQQAYRRNGALLRGAQDDVISGFEGARDRSLDGMDVARRRAEAGFRPALETGNNALGAYGSELGLNAKPKGFAGLSMSPAAKFMLEQGRTEIEGGAAGAGNLFSGATLQALEKERSGYAMQDKNNQMAQLFELVGVGQNAAGNIAGIETDFSGMRNGVESDYSGKIGDATGRYTGALADLNDTDYARRAGTNAGWYDGLSNNMANFTSQSINNTNNLTSTMATARNNRTSHGQSAAQGYATGGSNALANYGDARAAGAVGVGNSILGGMNTGMGIYGALGGTFGQGQENLAQGGGWPMNRAPMARPY